MNQEEMAKELDRIQEVLKNLDPTTEAYTVANKNYHELLRAFHEESAACNADLDSRHKRKMEEADFERREKETVAKIEQEQKRQELAEKEAKDKLKAAKMDAIIGLAKIGLTIGGTAVLVVVTGKLEETTILSNKCLAWIKALQPRVI